jgi:Tfp pilus assembly protein PilX
MNMKNKFKNNGSVLIVVVFVIALMTALVAGILQLNTEQIQIMKNEVFAAQAKAIAEGGLADAFAQLRSNPNWNAGFSSKSFGGGSYTVSVADFNVVSTGTSEQGFTARVQADITIGGISSPYIIRIDKLRINE